MRLTEIWRSRTKPTISFELFPARTEKAQTKLAKVIDTLAGLEPDFVSVTFGAGGSTREGSLQLAQLLRHEKRLQLLPYFAGFGLGPQQITDILDAYRELGVESLLVVRGDKPEGEFQPHPESFPHASEMLSFVRSRYDFCLGAAGYPEGHIAAESKQKDLEYLKLKVECGARFIIANYAYDTRFFLDFRERCQGLGIDVPILPGVMPIFSVKMMETLANLCGATITDEVRRGLEKLPEGDKDAVLQFGIELATRQCRELIQAGVPGIHIYTMDRSAASKAIVEQLRQEGLC